MPSQMDYAGEFIRTMAEREQAGLRTYGPFNPRTDTRVLCNEAAEEALDVGNYMRFLRRKHPELGEEAANVLRQAYKLFVALKQLESRERGLSETHPTSV